MIDILYMFMFIWFLFLSLRAYVIPLIDRSLITIDIERSLPSLLHRHIISSRMPYIMLPRPHNLILPIIQKLVPMSQPPHSPRNHKQYREHIGRKTHGFVYNSTVKINVGV